MDVELVCCGFGRMKDVEPVRKYVEKMLNGGVFLLKIKKVVLAGESDFCKICGHVVENLQKQGAEIIISKTATKEEKHLYFVGCGDDIDAVENRRLQKLLALAWCHREDVSLAVREYFLSVQNS